MSGKMKKITPVLILLCCLLCLQSFSSTTIRKAKRKIKVYNYSEAIVVLKKVLDQNDPKTKPRATLLLAECYRKKNNFQETKNWYGKVLEQGNHDSLNYLYYAMALRSLGDYEQAKKYFLKYDSLVKKDTRGRTYAGFCDSIQAWDKNGSPFEATNVAGLNSEVSEFGPVFKNDKVCFTTDRYLTDKKRPVYGWTGNNYLKIFYADLKNPADLFQGFQDPYIDKERINSRYHNGPATFDSAGTIILYNHTYKAKGERDPVNIQEDLLKIYYSTFDAKKNKWTKPRSFAYNSNEYSIGHPVLSKDGKTLYLVSNMPGGHGGTDIYISHFADGKWTSPQNAGPGINTFGNEMFPYLSDEGALYFASDGLPGYGSLDIFVTRQVNGIWETPVNMGRSINSSYDDFSLAEYGKTKTGLFCSNRPGGQGGDDIYYYRKTPPPPPVKVQFFVSGTVREKATNQPVPWATVFLFNKVDGKVLTMKADNNGVFRTEIALGTAYLAKAMQTGYTSDCESFIFELSEKETNLRVPRDLLLEKLPPADLKTDNVFYDFDRSDIRPDAQSALNSLAELLKANNISVELSSHADCRGSDAYNQKLSERRAESARQYLVAHGVDPSRITTKAFGEKQPVNNCIDGVPCTETQYQANRRTEFRIISNVPQPAEQFDPAKYGEGETIDVKTLPGNFFGECEEERKIVQS